MISEHPITIIENLLKLGIGDRGRLLYLRNYIKNGKPLYESDKKFLEKMCAELNENNSRKSDKPLDSSSFGESKKNTFTIAESNNGKIKQAENHSDGHKNVPIRSDSEILKIQALMGELKKSDSKLKDNLELLLISREALSQQKMEKQNSNNLISNRTESGVSNLLSLIKNDSNYTDFQFFKIKKHDLMTYTSAGLFVLWFASFQNAIDIGPLQNLFLGLSAGAAVSAGILYRRQRKS